MLRVAVVAPRPVQQRIARVLHINRIPMITVRKIREEVLLSEHESLNRHFHRRLVKANKPLVVVPDASEYHIPWLMREHWFRIVGKLPWEDEAVYTPEYHDWHVSWILNKLRKYPEFPN